VLQIHEVVIKSVLINKLFNFKSYFEEHWLKLG